MSNLDDIVALMRAWIDRRKPITLAKYMQVTPQRIYQIKREGRFPYDWGDELEALGNLTNDPFDRGWCRTRQRRGQASRLTIKQRMHCAVSEASADKTQ